MLKKVLKLKSNYKWKEFAVLFTLTFLLILPLQVQNVDAASIQTIHNRTYVVDENFVKVTESKETSLTEEGFVIPATAEENFTIFNPIQGDPNESENIQKSLNSIRVTNKKGEDMDYLVEETDGNNYLVKVPVGMEITTDDSSKITLTYESYGLSIQNGAVRDVYIPGLNDLGSTDGQVKRIVDTIVRIPNNQPDINFTIPEQNITQAGDFREININQSELVGQSVWIQLGKSQFFEFVINQEIPKTSNMPLALNTYTLPVPRDIQSGRINQQVFFTEISPNPSKTFLDEDKNLIFEFKTNSAFSQNIEIKGYAVLAQDGIIDLENSGGLEDISNEFTSYLQPGSFWEVDNTEIQQIAKDIKGDNENIHEITKATYDYVIDRIDYSFVKKYGLNERQGAVATLQGGAAVCMEYSDLFITLLRAQGIPARASFGYGYGSLDYLSVDENDINHQWAEVYYPNLNSWVAIDTTWGDFGNEILGGDLNHFYSHVASINPEAPSTSQIAYFGELNNFEDRQMEITIVESIDLDQGMSQAEILEKFASDSEEIVYLKVQNQTLDSALINLIGTDNSLVLWIGKGGIILSAILLLWVPFKLAKKVKS